MSSFRVAKVDPSSLFPVIFRSVPDTLTSLVLRMSFPSFPLLYNPSCFLLSALSLKTHALAFSDDIPPSFTMLKPLNRFFSLPHDAPVARPPIIPDPFPFNFMLILNP